MSRRLSDADRQVWARVARTVTPAPWKPLPSDRYAAEHTGLPEEACTAPRASRPAPGAVTPTPQPGRARPQSTTPPADLSGHRRIKRGRAPIDATIDLHGYTQEGARAALVSFVERQRLERARCLLVITGKGRMGAGVLRQRFFDWIAASPIRAHLSGYAPAHPKHGGGGAFYLFLKAS